MYGKGRNQAAVGGKELSRGKLVVEVIRKNCESFFRFASGKIVVQVKSVLLVVGKRERD